MNYNVIRYRFDESIMVLNDSTLSNRYDVELMKRNEYLYVDYIGTVYY